MDVTPTCSDGCYNCMQSWMLYLPEVIDVTPTFNDGCYTYLEWWMLHLHTVMDVTPTWSTVQTIGQLCISCCIGIRAIRARLGEVRAYQTVVTSETQELWWCSNALTSWTVVARATSSCGCGQFIVATVPARVTIYRGWWATRTVATGLALATRIVKGWTCAHIDVRVVT